MLTLEKLKNMRSHEIFASGITTDNSDGINMSNSGKELRWIAVRGDIHDWAIYCHFAIYDLEYIAQSGDKIGFKEHIQKLVPCDEEALNMYRF